MYCSRYQRVSLRLYSRWASYKSSDSDTCGNRGHRTSANVASDATSCGESTENEADVVESLQCQRIRCAMCSSLTIAKFI